MADGGGVRPVNRNGPSAYQTTHDRIRQVLRTVLVDSMRAGLDTTGEIGSVQFRACAALYGLLRDHPVDQWGRCRSCQRRGAVLRARWRRCRMQGSCKKLTWWLGWFRGVVRRCHGAEEGGLEPRGKLTTDLARNAHTTPTNTNPEKSRLFFLRLQGTANLWPQQLDEALLPRLLPHEPTPSLAPPAAPGPARADDPEDTDVLPPITTNPLTQPPQTPAAPPQSSHRSAGAERSDPDHGGAGDVPHRDDPQPPPLTQIPGNRLPLTPVHPKPRKSQSPDVVGSGIAARGGLVAPRPVHHSGVAR
jgi:hypothetical protein